MYSFCKYKIIKIYKDLQKTVENTEKAVQNTEKHGE